MNINIRLLALFSSLFFALVLPARNMPGAPVTGSDTLKKKHHLSPCPNPTVTASTTDASICSGVTTTLISVGSPVGGTYLWQPGGIPFQNTTVSPATTTLYTVLYTDSCGTGTDTVTVFVNPVPILTLNANVNAGCPTFCTQFYGRNTAGNVIISSWIWTFGDGDSAITSSPVHCYTNPGTYSVKLTGASTAGCSSTFQSSNLITVYPIPHAYFSYSPDPVTSLSQTVSFTDSSSGTYKIGAWFWNFGDNSNDTANKSENPSHKYSDTGTFCPTEVVEDIHGCTDTAVKCIHIGSVYNFYIPDAFSPNGDGRNEIFAPIGTDVKNFEMYIFDRWGLQVYHTTDIEKGWNGGLNNGSTICQEDSYAYLINVTDNHGKDYKYKGAVYLFK